MPEKSRKALIVVDVQNDFCPGGALAVTGGNTIIKNSNKLVNKFWIKGEPTIFTQCWHPQNTPHFGPDKWPVHCLRDSYGAQLHKSLLVPYGSILVRKGIGQSDDYSPFCKDSALFIKRFQGQPEPLQINQLNEYLQNFGVQELVVCGLATDYCVKAACLDARKLGYQVTLVTDACRAVNLKPGDEERAIEEMRAAGVVISTTDEVL